MNSGSLSRRMADGERLPALPCGRRKFSHPKLFYRGSSAVLQKAGAVYFPYRAAGKKFPAALFALCAGELICHRLK